MGKLIRFIYFTIALFLPLVFYTKTSELFEFNKMIFIYLTTIIVFSLAAIDIAVKGKFVIKKTTLTYPILFFLGALVLSTFVSIDFRTSLFGYYSRFHGGLMSYICYAILFWIFTLYFDSHYIKRFIKLLIISTVAASIYAGLEHFGYSPSCLIVSGNFDVECWVQDVQNRVFGTFGQPNWLAAWLVGIIPLAWFTAIENQKDSLKKYLYLFASILFILVLYYTKSRSGIIAFFVSYFIFWSGTFYLEKKRKNQIVTFAVVTLSVIFLTIFVNTPWQPKISTVSAQEYVAPALEHGGTESGDIRKIVWTGAWELFKKYPLLGTGLDTFAFSYYETRPMEHNMTSEWNYIYNRAHNEYLNFLATTGILGTTAYLILLISVAYVFISRFNRLNSALIASYSTILITNFFGFSTVAIGFLFFILPAISIASENKLGNEEIKIKDKHKPIIALVIAVSLTMIYLLFRYWQADIHYATGKKYQAIGDSKTAYNQLSQAINLNPNEANFYAEIAKVAYIVGRTEESDKYADKALNLSPHNVSVHKQVANTYSNLSKIDNSFAAKELRILEKLLELAPTDPSGHYKFASLMARTGNVELAIEKLKETIQMKPDYKLANILLAYLYEDSGQKELAKEKYEYILKYIDPNDQMIKEDLKNLDL